MAEKVAITEATKEDLLHFAQNVLFLDVDGRSSAPTIVAKIAESGWKRDFITVAPVALEEPRPDDSGRPAPYTTDTVMEEYYDTVAEKKRQRPRKRNWYGIWIEEQDSPGGKEAVPVFVNGRGIYISRNTGTAIPEEYVEVLENAMHYVYDEYDERKNFDGGLQTPRRVQSYPFRFVPNNQVTHMVNKGEVKRAGEVAA